MRKRIEYRRLTSASEWLMTPDRTGTLPARSLQPSRLADCAPPMLQETRQSEILNLLHVHRSCQISELAQRFDVSEETVRRDIRRLEAEGQAFRVHGGVKLSEKVSESPYMIRRNQNGDQKRSIAFHAASLVHDGMTVLIDSGSTTYWLAKALLIRRDLTIITNAVEVARELTGRNNFKVFLAGGEIDFNYQSCFGPETLTFMSQFVPDVALLSISAIDEKRGLLDVHHPEAVLKAALAPLASRIILLADASKFGKQGRVKALDFKQIDVLVTDQAPPPEFVAVFGDTEIHIVTGQSSMPSGS